nr:MAG TPA: KilAC domain protein [Caudoviricetes sp.]
MKATELLPITEKNASLTMSSREIAEIISNRHSVVCRSIERLIEKGVIKGYAPMVYTHEQNGQQYYEYHLEKRDTYIVVAQLSPEFTARLVDRWQELEAQQAVQLPQTFAEALRLAADLEEQKQALFLENQQLKPKAAFVEHYVEVGTTKSLRETAKILKMPEKAMIQRLVEDRILYRQSNNLLPYQKYHERELFAVKTGTAEHGHNFTQTRVTSKGMAFIANRYASELMQ